MRPAAAAALSATTAYSTWSARPSLPRGVYPPTQVLQMMSAFIKALLPPVLSEVLRTAGSLRSTDVTPFPRYSGPIRHPLVVGRLPGVAGYTTYPASALSGRDKEGFSSCSMSPGHHAVANHPAGATRRINRSATNCAAFALTVAGSAPGATHFRGHHAFTCITAWQLASIPRMAVSRGFRFVGFPPACPPSYGASDSYPGRTISCWTHRPFLDAQPCLRLSSHTALQ
jgi:hypothetical protein